MKEVDLTEPHALLLDVIAEVNHLHGITLDPGFTTSRGNNSEIARVGRKLLRLADQLALAEQIIRKQYWILRDLDRS